MEAGTIDLRGKMHRAKRQMPSEDVKEYLRSRKVAHVATKDAQGWPYITPLVYIYEDGDLLYLHSGDNQGHFLTNLQHDTRVCLEVADIGPLHQGKPYACNSALVYTSVVMFGNITTLYDRERKSWFLDRLLEKYGESDWKFEPGYPLIDHILLYELKMEIVTGKHSEGLSH
jgi:nitroimidazol reductase NimA-like FMN-containing flavoprotein (pyridoxamine 5'-phosphate oxidase superfamily)